MQIFVSAPHFFEELLVQEIQSLISHDVSSQIGGARFEADWQEIFKVLTHSRIGNRVYALVESITIQDENSLYNELKAINWDVHLDLEQSFKIETHVRKRREISERFLMFKMKDAIADFFKEKRGERPDVATGDSDIAFYVTLNFDKLDIYIDLSKNPLFFRGYRVDGAAAPLKENLAAGLLYRSKWAPDKIDTPFVDLFCGSGTLLIEAAGIANNVPPAFHWEDFSMTGWKRFPQEDFSKYRDEIKQRTYNLKGHFIGYDISPKANDAAKENVAASGFESIIDINFGDFTRFNKQDQSYFFVSNLPYGTRLSEVEALKSLYAELGYFLKDNFAGSQVNLLVENNDLSNLLGMKASRRNKVKNGALDCLYLQYQLFSYQDREEFSEKSATLTPGAEMFLNRLKKNKKRLKKYLKNNEISSYRLYDADMKEYNVAVDVYEGKWCLVQEYAPPKTVDRKSSEKRLSEVMLVLPQFLEIPKFHIYLKQRKRQKGKDQYEKLAQSGERMQMSENGLNFYVNFTDYLDSGIFLDHRITRQQIRDMSQGKRFLNLFAYTGSATVYAAAGGAKKTVTVDASNTYLNWAKENMELNGYSGKNHSFVKANCLEWLVECRESFDLIFLDPPTFSNSKTYGSQFSVETDHASLIRSTMKLLSDDGVLIFSNNFRKFKMDEKLFELFQIEDITESTLPEDFARNKKIHHCFRIQH